jgi:hypothetical protein
MKWHFLPTPRGTQSKSRSDGSVDPVADGIELQSFAEIG